VKSPTCMSQQPPSCRSNHWDHRHKIVVWGPSSKGNSNATLPSGEDVMHMFAECTTHPPLSNYYLTKIISSCLVWSAWEYSECSKRFFFHPARTRTKPNKTSHQNVVFRDTIKQDWWRSGFPQTQASVDGTLEISDHCSMIPRAKHVLQRSFMIPMKRCRYGLPIHKQIPVSVSVDQDEDHSSVPHLLSAGFPAFYGA
jgi:hypothetical protein